MGIICIAHKRCFDEGRVRDIFISFDISAYAHTHESEMPKEFQDEKYSKASVKYDAFHLEINDLKSRDLDITGVNLKTGEIDVLLF